MEIAQRGIPRTAAATYIGCSVRKFDDLVGSGRMPLPRLIDSKKVWDILELDKFFDDLPRLEDNDNGNEWDES